MKALLPKDSREAAKWASGFVATAATIVGVLATLGVIGGAAPSEAVAHAAEKLRDAGSSAVRLEMRVPGEDPDSGSTVEADGSLDYETGRGRFRYVLTDPQGERLNAEARFLGARLYFRLGQEWGLAKEHPWLGATLDELRSATSDGAADARVQILASLNFEGLTSSLDYLKRIGDVEEAGSAVIAGDETTRYDGTVRTGRSDVRVSVWVADDDDVLRRMRITLPDRTQAELEFDHFGTKVRVAEPPEDQVIELTDLPPSS